MNQKHKKTVSVLVVALKSPLLIGIYESGVLIRTLHCEEKTSDALPKTFKEILEEYTLENLYYANGPGSYMSIKITYIFLRTIAITQNIRLYAGSAFNFCNNMPIKALGKKYFVKKGDEVVLETIEPLETHFELPADLNTVKFSLDNEPNYILPAV
jgi:tRNA A37 threonylcarbamoyladenosine modification protein TsaB